MKVFRSQFTILSTIQAILIIFVLLFLITGFPEPNHVKAASNSQLSFQGRLTDSSGNPASGKYQILFSLYTQSTGGTAIWTESQNVTAKNGIFSAVLGSATPIDVEFSASQTYYLGIKVENDQEMTPRLQIGAALYAINSKKISGSEAGTGADNVLKLNSSGDIDIAGKITTTSNLLAGSSTLNQLTVKDTLTLQAGSLNLPSGSIETADLADDAITADKLYVAAINSDGKLTALTSSYLANLDGSGLTGVVATGIADGTITNAKVATSAAIAYSKLNLGSSLQGSDLATNIAISTNGTANFTGTFQLAGVALTSTATELNLLDGVTATTAELNFVDGVTSAIQTQFDARLLLAGGTMAGNIALGDNSLTGIDTLTFTDTAGTIAGIQNQNLVDKTDTETVSGNWSFTGLDTFSYAVPAAGGQVSSITQSTNDAASSSRSALTIKSSGTSNNNDYLILGYDQSDTNMFSVNTYGRLSTKSISASSTAANPVLSVNNSTGINDIVRFLDNGTSVFTIADGGNITATGDASYTSTASYTKTTIGTDNINILSLTVTNQGSGTIGGINIVQADSSSAAINTGINISNLDTNTSLTTGITISDLGGGGIITGIDLSGAGIITAINIGSHAIAGTNFSVTNAGAVTIGAGTAISRHLSTTAINLTSNNIPANSCANYASINTTAPVGDTVYASPDANSSANGIEDNSLSWNAVVTATDTITIRACNPTGADINTADDQEWRIDVWQH